MSLDFTDIFCGPGGSSIGLVAAGLELKLAANHWDRAIATHAENFPAADHLVADVSNYDMRRLPRTQVLWASPECTWHSPAGGRKSQEQIRAELDLFDEYVPNAAGVRSRATAFDVIRAAEVHRYKVIIVENVVEFAAWEMFDWWLAGLRNLGYTCQLISVSSAHVGDASNAPAPQWRDRLYVYCTAEGVPVPDVSPRPIAWCPTCDQTVAAVQSWRRPDRRQVGKYHQQYDYRCPNLACRHSIIEPFVLPAASIIDWSDLGTRIGDRESHGKKPLVAATLRRIQAGIDLFAEPTMNAPAFEICRTRNKSAVVTPISRSIISALIVISAITRLPRVSSVLIPECFLSVSMLPERMYQGRSGWVSTIHSQAASVALPTMFCPAASPVV